MLKASRRSQDCAGTIPSLGAEGASSSHGCAEKPRPHPKYLSVWRHWLAQKLREKRAAELTD